MVSYASKRWITVYQRFYNDLGVHFKHRVHKTELYSKLDCLRAANISKISTERGFVIFFWQRIHDFS